MSATTGWRILRSLDNNVANATTLVDDLAVSPTQYLDEAVTLDTEYWYWIVAKDAAANLSNAIGPVYGFPGPAIAAPTNLAVTAEGSTTVDLGWDAHPDGSIDGFLVYRDEAQIADIANPAATSYQATGLTNGLTYQFEIRAYRSIRTSPLSNSVSGTPTAATVELTGAADLPALSATGTAEVTGGVELTGAATFPALTAAGAVEVTGGAALDPDFVQVGTEGSSGGGSTTADSVLPGAITEGNVIICVVRAASTSTLSVAGFTQIGSVYDATGATPMRFAIFAKTAGASESTTITGTASPASVKKVVAFEVQDVKIADAVVTAMAEQTSTSSVAITTAGATPAAAPAFVFSVLCTAPMTAGTAAAAGMTVITSSAELNIAYEKAPSVASYDAAWTWTGGARAIAVTVALEKAA